MGAKDRDNWEAGSGKIPGCMCEYCAGHFNSVNLYDQHTGYTKRRLNDGELQYEMRTGPWIVGPPGCLKTKSLKQYSGDGFSATVLPDKPMEEAIVMVWKGHPVVCRKCNLQNNHGGPNQKDGGYVCWNCR
jgi:hypothetical protein